MKKLAVICTHPIQYYAPLFALLSKSIELKVFYTWGEQSISKYDPGFGERIEWDIPLLSGYKYEFLSNTASEPGSHHFRGIINPDAISRLNEFQPSAIFITGWSYLSHLKIIRHFSKKVPVWFRGDSTLLDERPGIKSIIKYLFLKWLYLHVDKAFYVGTNNKRYFERFGMKPIQLVFAPHAVDNKRFSFDYSAEAKQLRHKLMIQDDNILIVFAGKFEYKKDPLLLLSAFQKLSRPETHLLFVGNGSLEQNLKRQSETWSSNIHFMSFQNQSMMPIIYHACDLFCLPSKGPGETWGLSINEAMACGKAVLVSDKVGCSKDLVRPSFNGDIFRAGSKEDLLHKLDGLCDIKMLKIFGINSRTLINSWSFEAISKKIQLEWKNVTNTML